MKGAGHGHGQYETDNFENEKEDLTNPIRW